MKAKEQIWKGKDTLETIEEAVHLLRLAPFSLLATYYIGSLPFVLGFLYFWSDMSRSTFAPDHCVEASLGIALLYLWMKSWQAIFCAQLKKLLSGHSACPWTFQRVGRLILTQLIYQPFGLIAIPIGALVMLPFGWLYAFYQNLSVIGDGTDANTSEAFRKSWRQASLWPMHNHLLILTTCLFGIFVFINLTIAVFGIPHLLHTLLGVESKFVLSGWHILNTTFFVTVVSITYLCINPLEKAIYTLRCFYGEAIHTAADLRADLKYFSRDEKKPSNV